MNNKNIFARFFETFDTGSFFKRPLQWIYILFGIGNLCLPIYLTILFKDNEYKYDNTTGMIISLIYLFIVAIFNVYFWINRSSNLGKYVARDNNLTVIPLIAHMTKTFGEWLGINTLLDAIPLMVLLKNDLPIRFILLIFIGCIFFSYFIILIGHFIAEEINVFAAIANNTKLIAESRSGEVPRPSEEPRLVQTDNGNGPKVKEVNSSDSTDNNSVNKLIIMIGGGIMVFMVVLLIVFSTSSTKSEESQEPQKTEISNSLPSDTSAVVDSMPNSSDDYSHEDTTVDQSYGNESSSSDYSSDDEYGSSSY